MNETNDKKAFTRREIIIGGIRDVDILLFTKHLSMVLKSGMTLSEGLEILEQQTKGKMTTVISGLLQKVNSGEAFYVALGDYKKYFSQIYISMVRSGEFAGTLEQNLGRIAIQIEKNYKLKKKVKSAMIYPTFIFIALFGLGMSVSLFVLPKLLPLFKTLGVELPLTTQGLIYVAELFEAQGVLLVLYMIIGIISTVFIFKMNFIKPFSHWALLKVPVLKKIIQNVNLERFTRSLGSMLESGLTIDDSLRITAESLDNRVYRKAVFDLIPKVESGDSLLSALQKTPIIFPQLATKMIGMGERTGNLDSTLTYLSDFYEGEVDEAIKNLSIIIEPVLLLFIGILVALVAMAIISPIYQITGNLRN